MTSEAHRHRLLSGGAVQHKGITMKPLQAAIHAAKKVPAWGLFAAMRYAMKNGATFAQFSIEERYEDRRRIRQRIRNDFQGWLA